MTASPDTHVYPVLWQDDHLVLIDQRQLPERYHIVSINRCEDVVRALRSGIVQGGSALGIAAAYGLYLGAGEIQTEDAVAFWERIEAIGDQFKQTRPDKANLQWAVDQMLSLAHRSHAPVEQIRQQLLAQAQTIQAEDFTICQAIGDHGLKALPHHPQALTVFTHCNHGALATSGYGTSLGIMRSAWHQGRLARVYAGETRPTLQGSRLTAWECVQEGIPVTIVTDSMAAHCMQKGLIHVVLAGADCIAANGDVISKIGTYSLALGAQAHNIPFLVAASASTIDFNLASGESREISQRLPEEIYKIGDTVTSPGGAEFYNPASDVTPARLITAIITEQGALLPNQLSSLRAG
ncbi:MAG: S-methyl-5-thioribose-1-phosphate isomerase [Leptolyngbyaceae cyanobacterium SM2_3_12]|nr:S-methyl-5-thioribose-1-phosphate isomerase [Leptolyngbyaceae cyanobacterium SM2_3_12]